MDKSTELKTDLHDDRLTYLYYFVIQDLDILSSVLDTSRRTSQAMPPKKAKTTETSRKKTPKKSPFYNRGYCKKQRKL